MSGPVVNETLAQQFQEMRSREAVQKYLTVFLAGDARLGESVIMTAPDGSPVFEGVVSNPLVLERKRELMAAGLTETEAWVLVLKTALREGPEALSDLVNQPRDGDTVHVPRRSDD